MQPALQICNALHAVHRPATIHSAAVLRLRFRLAASAAASLTASSARRVGRRVGRRKVDGEHRWPSRRRSAIVTKEWMRKELIDRPRPSERVCSKSPGEEPARERLAEALRARSAGARDRFSRSGHSLARAGEDEVELVLSKAVPPPQPLRVATLQKIAFCIGSKESGAGSEELVGEDAEAEDDLAKIVGMKICI